MNSANNDKNGGLNIKINKLTVKSNDVNEAIEIFETIRSSEIMPKDEKDMRCAPSKKFENGSCIPANVLVKMAEAYNQENPDDKIPLDHTKETLNPKQYKRFILKQFKKRLDGKCNDQKCWVRQNFIKRLEKEYQEDLKTNTFRPKGPEGKFTWLNTLNIDQVMKQYEAKYPEFKFLGAVPADFDNLPELGIKDLDLKKLMSEGKTRIGVVFNTDESWKQGMHWNALFGDLTEGKVYFSDSYGVAPEKRVRKLMTRIANFIQNDLGKKPIVEHNKLQHQRGGSECGQFSINFIIRLLRGDSFEELTSKRIPDSVVNNCRNVYFT